MYRVLHPYNYSYLILNEWVGSVRPLGVDHRQAWEFWHLPVIASWPLYTLPQSNATMKGLGWHEAISHAVSFTKCSPRDCGPTMENGHYFDHSVAKNSSCQLALGPTRPVSVKKPLLCTFMQAKTDAKNCCKAVVVHSQAGVNTIYFKSNRPTSSTHSLQQDVHTCAYYTWGTGYM